MVEEGAYTIGVFTGNIVFALFVVIALFLFAWITALIWKRWDVVDAFWGLGFMVVAWCLIAAETLRYESLKVFVVSGGVHQALIWILVTAWGVRLCFTIARRLWSHSEDKRYVEMREKWGGRAWLQALMKVFLLQAVLCTVVALPIITAASSRFNAGFISFAVLSMGALVWVAGFLCEAVADWQLSRFRRRKDSGVELLTTGVWTLSRHPNYFGELMQWWGIWMISASSGIILYMCIAAIGPALLTFLITKVSGIPLAEKHMQQKKGFDVYKAQVPVLVPSASSVRRFIHSVLTRS